MRHFRFSSPDPPPRHPVSAYAVDRGRGSSLDETVRLDVDDFLPAGEIPSKITGRPMENEKVPR